MIDIGDPAPDFSATEETGAKLRLSELCGRPVVLHFFALAWTGV